MEGLFDEKEKKQGLNWSRRSFGSRSLVSARMLGRLIKKIGPLLQAKKDTDDVHSKGYFENNFPDADMDLKTMIADRVMAAWDNTKTDEGHEEPDGDEGPSINININLGR